MGSCLHNHPKMRFLLVGVLMCLVLAASALRLPRQTEIEIPVTESQDVEKLDEGVQVIYNTKAEERKDVVLNETKDEEEVIDENMPIEGTHLVLDAETEEQMDVVLDKERKIKVDKVNKKEDKKEDKINSDGKKDNVNNRKLIPIILNFIEKLTNKTEKDEEELLPIILTLIENKLNKTRKYEVDDVTKNNVSHLPWTHMQTNNMNNENEQKPVSIKKQNDNKKKGKTTQKGGSKKKMVNGEEDMNNGKNSKNQSENKDEPEVMMY